MKGNFLGSVLGITFHGSRGEDLGKADVGKCRATEVRLLNITPGKNGNPV